MYTYIYLYIGAQYIREKFAAYLLIRCPICFYVGNHTHLIPNPKGQKHSADTKKK